MSADVPSNPADRQKLKTMLVEITKSYLRIDAEKDLIKSSLEDAQEKFGIKKKLINKLAKTLYNNSYADLQAENEHFELLYETLVEGKISVPTLAEAQQESESDSE